MPKIADISAYKVVNSRGDWTLRTKVVLDDGAVGVETIPEGASKGEREAACLPVEEAIENVNTKLFDLLETRDPFDQEKIDKLMIDFDGTGDKSYLGGNAILSVSLAAARAAAKSQGVELYVYLASLFKKKPDGNWQFPTPVFNVLNGGKHAHNGLSFQEFMVIPAQNLTFDQAYEMGVNIYHDLKQILQEKGHDVDVGDEGGFAPNGLNPKDALELVAAAASQKYEVGDDVFLGMDVAAESFHVGDKYSIKEEKLLLTGEELAAYYAELLKVYPIVFLEDPFYEGDLESWRGITAGFGPNTLIVGDDLVVTNENILVDAVDEKLCNAVIVKPNQVGTLTETLKFIKLAQKNEMAICVSHRSGDTAEDTFIADLAVAVDAEFIKSGAPARGERVAKYNRLLEIFHETGGSDARLKVI